MQTEIFNYLLTLVDWPIRDTFFFFLLNWIGNDKVKVILCHCVFLKMLFNVVQLHNLQQQ